MSRVAITDLVPGTEATTTDVNATLTSWNTAVGAAALGANNFRQEGIDRKSLDDNVVFERKTQFAESGTPTSTNVATAAYAKLRVNAQDVQTVALTSTGTDSVVKVRATVFFQSDKDVPTVAADFFVGFRLRMSTDNGVTWSILVDTEQFIGMKYVNASYDVKILGQATMLYQITTTAGTSYRFRVEYVSANSDIFVYNAVVYAEIVAR